MSKAGLRTAAQNDPFSDVLAEFSKTFGSPSSKYANVRCVSKAALIRELVELRDRHSHSITKSMSGRALLELLLRSGVVQRVPHIEAAGSQPPAQFFSIGLNEPNLELDPIELLQAMEPQGVICYFTAVQFHNLSTQIPTHHQVARLSKTSSPRPKASSSSPVQRTLSTDTQKKRDRLGKRQFLYQGIPYYITSRKNIRMPGIQKRYYTNKTIVSITDYEQTLLDTLDRPLSCGGPSVVFEAWENGMGEFDQSRILAYLRAIKDKRLTRRVGYMLFELLQSKLDSELQRYLNRIRTELKQDQTAAVISLLPGYEYSHPNHDWNLEVP